MELKKINLKNAINQLVNKLSFEIHEAYETGKWDNFIFDFSSTKGNFNEYFRVWCNTGEVLTIITPLGDVFEYSGGYKKIVNGKQIWPPEKWRMDIGI